MPYTKEQMRLNSKKYREANPMKTKIKCWKQKIGLPLTQGEWEEIYHKWVACENCECCGKVFDTPVPGKCFNDKQLDHCHKTMKFRNFLCNKCNKMRGYLDTDYQTIMKLMTM